MKATILIKNAAFIARHGVFREEATLGQRFEVDLEVDADIGADADHDEVKLTVGYDALYATLSEVMMSARYKLIEALGDKILRAILANHPRVEQARLEIRKPAAPLGAIIDYAAVRLTKSRHG